jgi:WD40 repeat protein
MRNYMNRWLWVPALLFAAACVGHADVGEPIRVTLTPVTTAVVPVVTTASATSVPQVEIESTVVPEEDEIDTSELPVGVGTPVPDRSGPISATAISEIVELARWDMGFINALDFSHEGAALVVGLGDYWEGESSFGVRVINTNDGTLMVNTGGHSGGVVGVDISPDGELLVSADEDGRAHLWRLPDGDLLAEMDHPGYLTGVVVSPDCLAVMGCQLAVGVNNPQHWGEAYLWRLSDADTLASGGVPEQEGVLVEKYGRVNSLCFSPDGTMLATGSKGIVRVWRVLDGVAVLSLEESPAMVSRLAFSPDGALLAAASEGGRVFIWKLGERGTAGFGDFLTQIGEGGGRISGLQFSPDGQLLVAGYVSGLLQVWQVGAVQAGQNLPVEQVYQMDLASGKITSLAISPAGDLLALGLNDLYQAGGPVTLWGIPADN